MTLPQFHRAHLLTWLIGLIAIVAVALLSSSHALSLAVVGVSVMAALGIVMKKSVHRFWNGIGSGWPLLIILIPFYFSPYTNVAPSMRDPGSYISIYYHVGGLFCLMDAMLASALVIVFISRARQGQTDLFFGAWQGIGFLFAIILTAFAIGLLHADGGALHYGVTELKRPIIALMPALYMLAMFVLVNNTVQSVENLRRLLRWLDWLTILLLLYAISRLILILTGKAETLWGFGLPIILYDQMAMLYVPIFVLTARAVLGVRLSWWQWAQLLMMILLILWSTRRYNYLLLLAGVVLVVLLSLATGSLQRWRFRRTMFSAATVLGLSGVFLTTLFPRFTKGIVTSFRTLDFTSRVGQKYGGNIRAASIDNMFNNLDRRPYAYVSGFGLGTMWQAIEHQPIDPFTKRLRKNDGWYAQFSTPYISLLFRLGLLGMLTLLIWLASYLRTHIRRSRGLSRSFQPTAMGLIIFLVLIIPALPDSLNPTGWVLCGLYMGILEKFKTLGSETEGLV